MAKIRWTADDQRWIKDIFEYIAANNPDAATQTVSGIYERTQVLAPLRRSLGHTTSWGLNCGVGKGNVPPAWRDSIKVKNLFSMYLKKICQVELQGDAWDKNFYPALAEMLGEVAQGCEKYHVRITTLPKRTERATAMEILCHMESQNE